MPTVRAYLREHWRKLAIAVVAVAAVAVIYSRIDVHRVHDYFQKWPGWALFSALVLLPLAGFPASVMHAIAGMRWGPRLGLALVVCSILLQLLASYALVALFRKPFERWLAAFPTRVTKGGPAPVTLFTVLLPGAPFFAQNYVIPVVGVPLRTFVMVALPVDTLRATISVMFGHESDQLTPWRIAGFAAYALVLILSFAWAFRRLRAEVGDRRRAANGRKPPA